MYNFSYCGSWGCLTIPLHSDRVQTKNLRAPPPPPYLGNIPKQKTIFWALPLWRNEQLCGIKSTADDCGCWCTRKAARTLAPTTQQRRRAYPVVRQYCSTLIKYFNKYPIRQYCYTLIKYFNKYPIRQYCSTLIKHFNKYPVVRKYCSKMIKYFNKYPIRQYCSTMIKYLLTISWF